MEKMESCFIECIDVHMHCKRECIKINLACKHNHGVQFKLSVVCFCLQMPAKSMYFHI